MLSLPLLSSLAIFLSDYCYYMRKGKSPRPLVRNEGGFALDWGQTNARYPFVDGKRNRAFSILHFFFLCGNGSKERTVPGTWDDVYIYPRHVTLEV